MSHQIFSEKPMTEGVTMVCLTALQRSTSPEWLPALKNLRKHTSLEFYSYFKIHWLDSKWKSAWHDED